MSKFKIEKGDWFAIKSFQDLTAAQNYTNGLGIGYTVEPFIEPLQLSPQNIIMERIDYGNILISQFLQDNALQALLLFNDGLRPSRYLTTAETLALTVKFKDIITLAQLGSIRQILDILPSIAIDDIFTQARKDEYIAMITEYLSI